MMQRRALAFLFSSIAMGSLSATQPGPAVQDRLLPAFHEIAVNGVGTIRVHRGAFAVRLTIDADLAGLYETSVRNDRLNLGFRCGFRTAMALRKLRTCEIDVTLPDLDQLVVNGKAVVSVDEFDYGELKVDVNGNAMVDLAGSARILKVGCTGACVVEARRLSAGSATVGLTGSCRVELAVRDELSASITGAGELVYLGQPKLAQRISGSGILRRAGD